MSCVHHTLPGGLAAAERATRFGKRPKPAVAPSYDYPVQAVGTTAGGTSGSVSVLVDPALGAAGLALATQFFDDVAALYNASGAYFGANGEPVTVVIAPLSGLNDGSGGAYHYGCTFADGNVIYLDATFAAPSPAVMLAGLFVAELVECFEGLQDKGWGCGFSNGEALSRFLAELQSGGPAGALAEFATFPAWFSGGKPDWIDSTEPTDQDDVATGCGVGYLWWMVSRGFTPAQIAEAAGATLATNYQTLTGKTTAWADFSNAVATLGTSVTTDNPWTGGTSPPPPPPPPPASATPLFTLESPGLAKGQEVSFALPVALPSGIYAVISYPDGLAAQLKAVTAISKP